MILRNSNLIKALAGAFVVISGCSQYVDQPVETAISQTVIASNDDIQTKTCISGSVGSVGSNVIVQWTPTDELGVFTSSESNIKYTKYNRTDNEDVAAFVASESVIGTPQYSYYPYSANAGSNVASLSGNLPNVQIMDPVKRTLPGDWKVGEFMENSANGAEFKFTHLFSPIRVIINGSGTGVSSDVLEGIDLTVTRNGNPVQICGDFTFNAKDGSYSITKALSEVTFNWSTTQALSTGSEAFGTIFPKIQKGDIMSFVIRTSSHSVTLTVKAAVDFQPNTIYTFPLTLSKYASNPDEYGYKEIPLPSMSAFEFKVADNSTKLLNNKLTWNSSSNDPEFKTVSTHTASFSGANINVMIPYLYDFKLVPTFTASAESTVTAGGQVVTSGKTEIDFSQPVTFTVTAGGESRDYVVNVTNTGIPVVVLKHSTSGDFSEKQTEGGFLGFGKKTLNNFVNFWVRGKDTDFVKDDVLTVYNANGTIDMTSTCGAKLRGNTSQEYPKKPFAIKLTGDNKILNMPAHKRWVLLANWLDHSMIRNTVAFDIAHTIEKAWREKGLEPGIPWNVHGQNVELVVIDKDGVGHHVGNYFLCEQIKIHGNRLNIQEPYEDVTNPTLETCGYLFEIDNNYDEDYQFKTSNTVPVMFKDAMPDQTIFNAIKSKIQGIEDNLDAGNYSTAYENLDIYSVIDQLIIWELTMNREYGDPRSVYYFMDGNNKLSAGPVWDFDRGTFQNTAEAASMGNSDRVKPYNEWMYWRTDENDGDSYIWYRQLAKDATFKKAVQDRWEVIYPYLQGVSDQIRMYGETLKLSFESDSAMWPTDKAAIQEHKSGFSDWSGDEELPTFEQVINNFVQVYEARLGGMNTLITSGQFTN